MKIVCISGKAGHGKDTVAKMMKDSLEEAGNSVLITHYADLVKYICKTFFGWDGKKDENGRHMMQYVGTDIVRAHDPDYWVRFVKDICTFFYGQWDYVLIPDARFQNEIDYMRGPGMEVAHVRVRRDMYSGVLTDEQKEHVSETALDNSFADYQIINNGSLDDLRKSAEQVAADLGSFHQMSPDGL